jgi:heparin binding hemagglutinin HbhA
MPTDTQNKIPNPVYAAAGAGDLAIERLRKLPEKVAGLQERVAKAQDELPGRFTVIQDKVTQKVAELPSIVAELRQRMVDTDTDKFRESARRNADLFGAKAQAAQEKAAAIYAELVARGERVVGGNAPATRNERIHAEIVPGGTADVVATDTAAKPAAKPAAKSAPKPTVAKAAKAAKATKDN